MVTGQGICLYRECHTCYQEPKIWKFNYDINLIYVQRKENRWNVTKMQFYIESISFKGQCVPTESVSFFILRILSGIFKPYLSPRTLIFFFFLQNLHREIKLCLRDTLITLIDKGRLQKLASRKVFSGEKKKLCQYFLPWEKLLHPEMGPSFPFVGQSWVATCETQTVAEVYVFPGIPNFICELAIFTPSRLRESLKNNVAWKWRVSERKSSH